MFSFVVRSFLFVLLVFFVNNTSLYASNTNYPQVMFIFDASGSMWAKAGNESKIEAAKNVMGKIVPDLPSEVKVGLAVYGHRRKGDCKDIEIIIPPGSDDRKNLIAKIDKLTPKGKTPIADTISLISEKLKSFENETTIILVSDGEETCHTDPCGVVKKLKDSGIKFILHVVGFAVNDKQKAQLECLSKAGGGKYFSAKDAKTLLSALESVKKEVTQKVVKAKTVTKKAVTRLGKIEILMPQNSYQTLNTIKIIRKKDNKIVKTIKSPKSGSFHPLLSGEYEIVAGYANTNYQKDSEVLIKTLKVEGGKTTKVSFGALALNIADALKKIPADFLVIQKDDDPNFKIVTTAKGNSYYFYKTKPLPAGKYSFIVHYGTYVRAIMKESMTLLSNITVEDGKTTTINIATGFKIKKPKDITVDRWQLIPKGEEKALLDIKRPWDNDFPLWAIYAVSPGKYDVVITAKGMSEPLTVAKNLEIKEGEIVDFDTGL